MTQDKSPVGTKTKDTKSNGFKPTDTTGMDTKKKVGMFLKKYAKRYFIDALGSMVYGPFASLLIGTILKTIFGFIHIDALYFISSKSFTGRARDLPWSAPQSASRSRPV